LEINFTYAVPAKVLYAALLDPMELSKATRCLAKIDGKVGGEFNLLEGKIQGSILELDEGKRIKETWKLSDWPSFSEVELTFKDFEDGCYLKLVQTKIPSVQDAKSLKSGWKSFIFKPLSEICGYTLEEDDI